MILSLCVLLLSGLVEFGRSTIRNVDISYPQHDIPPHPSVTLPFVQGPHEMVEHFRADVMLTWRPYAPTLFTLYPDDCIESVIVNGVTVFDQTDNVTKRGCYPDHYLLDANGFLKPGDNRMTVFVANLQKSYAFDIVASFTPAQILVIATSLWVALYMGWSFVLHTVPAVRLAIQGDWGRAFARVYLAALGVLLTSVTLWNQQWWGSLETRPLVMWLACLVPLCLLARTLDYQRSRPMTFRPSTGWTVLAVGLFLIVTATHPADTYYHADSLWLKCLGSCLAALFAINPFFAFLQRASREPRAVAISVLAAVAPLLPFAYKLPLWEQMAKPTADAVSLLLWLTGVNTTTSVTPKVSEYGAITDYHAYVASSDFAVQIGSWCGGYEGIAIFLFLLSIMLLLDWRRFSRLQHLWVLFAATVIFVLSLNVIRITALFLYAEVLINEVGHGEAVRRTVDTFHSHAGLVLYTAAFWPFLVCVYRWERYVHKKHLACVP